MARIESSLDSVNPELIEVTGSTFVAQLRQDLEEAGRAFHVGDAAGLKQSAQGLRHILVLFGLDDLADAAHRIELSPEDCEASLELLEEAGRQAVSAILRRIPPVEARP